MADRWEEVRRRESVLFRIRRVLGFIWEKVRGSIVAIKGSEEEKREGRERTHSLISAHSALHHLLSFPLRKPRESMNVLLLSTFNPY